MFGGEIYLYIDIIIEYILSSIEMNNEYFLTFALFFEFLLKSKETECKVDNLFCIERNHFALFLHPLQPTTQ